jgi:glutamine---fructose-6-phosphate transaminase (isomerizing)
VALIQRRLIEGSYLRDILDQPIALHNTFERLHLPHGLDDVRNKLQSGSAKRVVLTGMGSSFHILTPLYLALAEYGYEVRMIETSELVYYIPALFNPQSVLICISQSGRSAEMIRLLEKNAGQATLISITNSPDSPLALASDILLPTYAGEEFSISSKTYVSAVLPLQMLGAYMCGDSQDRIRQELSRAETLAAVYLAPWRDHVQELASCLEGICHIFLVGRGGSLAAADTGALITKESVGVHAEAMSCAAFRHGPLEMVTEDTFVGVFEGDGITRNLNHQLQKDIVEGSGRAELIGPQAEIAALRIDAPARLLPIAEILPVQMMTIALAYLAGTEAGVFTRASKVTTAD